MFGKKKQLQERAEDLIFSCKWAAERCNSQENFGLFMEEFLELLANAKELCDISKSIKLKGITGNPCEDYQRIQGNAQLSIQDALNRNFDKLVREIKGDKSKRAAQKRISIFQRSIEEYQPTYNQSTQEVAAMLMNKLEELAKSLPDDPPISKDLDLLVAAADIAIEKGWFSRSIAAIKLNLDFAQAREIEQILLRCGVLTDGDAQRPNNIAISNSDLVRMRIKDVLASESFTSHPSLTVVDTMEGHDFEYWCADLLKANGFTNVEVTRGSGDQGVDILAEKDDVRYAIQCKCYSSDLGNTPVQEVYAGKTFYHCQVGAVMTNRFFTAGAVELAKSNGVLLWDRNKLEEWMVSGTLN